MMDAARWQGSSDNHAVAETATPAPEVAETATPMTAAATTESATSEAAMTGAAITESAIAAAAIGRQSRDGAAANPRRRRRNDGSDGRGRGIGRGWAPRLLIALVAACGAGWVGGFVWFLEVTGRPVQPPPYTDGIVALTGGAGRVELALRLLASGRADRLLLSGIGGGTDLATLGRLAGVETAGFAERVTLGRYAASTRGNGVETAAWAQQNHIRSLIVVTASYHMPRAVAELHQALPDVRLYPVPVLSLPTHQDGEAGPGLRLQAEEFTKYLLTASGLSAWLPRREPVPAPGMPGGAGG